MQTKTKWLITATPPTSNGDLHVGHLSGPYLAADVFRRAQISRGDDAVYVSFGDDNQSYIVTTAERLNVNPKSLLEKGNAEIQKTFSAYEIDLDSYKPIDQIHQRKLQDFFQSLYNAGAFYEKEVEMLYDASNKRFLFESFIQGYCPICISHTKGGICEDCGHPNDAHELIAPSPVGVHGEIETRTVRRLFMDLDSFKDDLIRFYESKKGYWRPHILRLVDELLAKDSLGQFPMTLPMSWGASVDLPGWDGHVWNAMAEMGPGLLNALNGACQGNAISKETKLVQFLGYDNSYFFAIVNVCLQMAAERHDIHTAALPDWIITNEFYSLEDQKFSTSKGHAIWGRELLEQYSSDEVRFYIAQNAPELATSNFIPADMQNYVNNVMRPRFDRFEDALKGYLQSTKDPKRSNNSSDEFLAVLEERFSMFYSPDTFSIRESSQLLSTVIDFVTVEMEASSDSAPNCDICKALELLVRNSAPIVPEFSKRLSESM